MLKRRIDKLVSSGKGTQLIWLLIISALALGGALVYALAWNNSQFGWRETLAIFLDPGNFMLGAKEGHEWFSLFLALLSIFLFSALLVSTFVNVLENVGVSVREGKRTNNYLYSGSYDHSIKKWDIYTGKCIKTLYGHTSTVTSIAYSHNYLVTSSGDIIRVWNCLNDECVSIIHAGEHCFGSVHSVAYNGK